jgi:carbonic anhydrase
MFDELLAANATYATTFTLGDIAPRAGRHFGLVTCMDSRIEPLMMLGLRPGDAKILRNAGGRVTPDVLRSLALATTYLNVTHVAIMHHTACALADTDDQELRRDFTSDQKAATAGWDLLGMPDPDAALTADVLAVRTFPGLAPGVVVEGWRYDVKTGIVHRVVD